MIHFTLQRYNFFSNRVTFATRFYTVKMKHKIQVQNDIYFYPPNSQLPVAR